MNEEEIALKTLKEVASDDFDTLGDDISPKMAQNILNLIENQQKEIEREKQYTDFYKDLCDKQQRKMRELLDNKKEINYIKPIDIPVHNYISKDKIRKRIKHNEEQKNIVVSVARFKINDDGITGEGIEGLNDLIVYKSYEAVINELNYLLEEK